MQKGKRGHGMKVIRKSVKIFRAECPYCYTYLEYDRNDILFGDVKCPCCGNNFSHATYGEPVRESEYTEGENESNYSKSKPLS